jgi:hypothetical protein
MTNRLSGAAALVAADRAAAIPGPPFRKTGAGLIGASAQATNPLQANIRAKVVP